MIAIFDSTVLLHLTTQNNKMMGIIDGKGITKYHITRINYIELLSGASINAKASTRKFLQQFSIIEFDAKAVQLANNLAMRYRVGKKQSKDFLIAAIAIANKLPLLTENTKDFDYKELKLMTYRITAQD